MTTITASQLPSWLNPDFIPEGLHARIADAQQHADETYSAIISLACHIIEVVEETDNAVRDLPDQAWEAVSEAIGFMKLHAFVANLANALDAATNGANGRASLAAALEKLTKGEQ